jgi:hypothetical protein
MKRSTRVRQNHLDLPRLDFRVYGTDRQQGDAHAADRGLLQDELSVGRGLAGTSLRARYSGEAQSAKCSGALFFTAEQLE